jgi:hypothetical protein
VLSPVRTNPSADAQDLAVSLERLVDDALRIRQALEGVVPTREAALERCVSGLGGPSSSVPLQELAVGARLLALEPERSGDIAVVLRLADDRHGHTCAAVDGIVFVLVSPQPRRGVDDPARAAAHGLWKQLASRVPCRTAISSWLSGAADVRAAARDVRDLLVVLHRDNERLGLVEDSWARLMTHRLGEGLVAASPLEPVLAALERSPFVETLLAWLRADGDTVAASAALGVHPNTARYRLRRLEEQCGLDLTDRHQRIALQLWCITRRPTVSPLRPAPVTEEPAP